MTSNSRERLPEPSALELEPIRPLGARQGQLVTLAGTAPFGAVAIEISDGWTCLLRVELPSTADRAPMPFSAALWTLGAPRLLVEALTGSGERLGTAEVALGAADPPHETPGLLQPLLVAGLGRSGTSLLMHLLASHPQLVVAGEHPFEVRPAGFWLQQLRFEGHPQHAERRDLPDQLWRRADPLRSSTLTERTSSWLRGDALTAAIGAVYQRVEAFYRPLAAASASHFVEKDPQLGAAGLTRALYHDQRTIVLVRDPRDLFASMLAMNRRRGSAGFGRERVASDDEHLALVVRRFRQLGELARFYADSRCAMVRYEDLVLAAAPTLARLLGELDLESGDAIVDAAIDRVGEQHDRTRMHRTTSTSLDSVGRHADDLTATQRESIEDQLGDLLAQLGYG